MMIYGIPLLRNRVAPRCTIADSILLLKFNTNKIVYKKSLKINEKSWNDLIKIFNDNNVGTLICGGINNDSRNLSLANGISVIENVSCSEKELIEGIKKRTLKKGFGFSQNFEPITNKIENNSLKKDIERFQELDCISCKNHQCMKGDSCSLSLKINLKKRSKEIKQILNSALDISFEDERVLCRLSELIYFALEMNYKKIGIAYCTELEEPAEIVTQVMRRFFDVFPVCCKIGGKELFDKFIRGKNKIACNPIGQAAILNKYNSNFNIIIGLCIGTDIIFTRLSKAPVSTLFVKDKSLANNPISAVHLDYYLKEAVNTQLV